ncbi:MAG: glycosyltransferase, partial [candidate division KSB1 bacterium]|nr:glycosyltransferase [candidate division KSB1 bacterium]
YPLFDIKVLPSETEGLSQALLEAMALGVPVIAADAAGNPDLIRDGENGLLYKAGDSRHLAQQIERLLHDQALYRTLQENGRKTALDDFSIERTIERYEEAFTEIIRKRHEKS